MTDFLRNILALTGSYVSSAFWTTYIVPAFCILILAAVFVFIRRLIGDSNNV